MATLDSHLLIATPQLRDPNFAQSVVLIVQHDENGALGLTLNRTSSRTVRQTWQTVGEGDCSRDEPLRLGGPIVGPLMAIHTLASVAERQLLPGVYFSAQPEQLRRVVVDSEVRLLLFSGYSGWGGGQLEEELRTGSWHTLPATPDHLFENVDLLWKTVAQQVANRSVYSKLGIKHVPDDPSWN